MADGAITVTIDDAGVRAGLAKLVGRLAHMAPVMEDIGRALGNLTEDAFQAQGPGWPALRPVTVKCRGNAGPILRVSGGSGLAAPTAGTPPRRGWGPVSPVGWGEERTPTTLTPKEVDQLDAGDFTRLGQAVADCLPGARVTGGS
jgi:hypothetical protein